MPVDANVMSEDSPGCATTPEEVHDGIRQKDNPIPRWWKWLFALTVIWGLLYAGWHVVGGGTTPREAYEAELTARAEQRTAAYGTLVADEATILAHMNDEATMRGMRNLFLSKCAPCHRADGGGSIGPNLTDEYWLRVKNVTDIAQIIREGVAEKGMPGWQGVLTETQITLLSAYVAQLQRHPASHGKGAEGQRLELPTPAPPPAASSEDVEP
jgi:cytochrome c oxidase cbb3-type subunit 3